MVGKRHEFVHERDGVERVVVISHRSFSMFVRMAPRLGRSFSVGFAMISVVGMETTCMPPDGVLKISLLL